MMILETLCLNALDFLPLLSGASFEEVERDLREKKERERISCLKDIQATGLPGTVFFFGNGERFFLEVLYLKLSFLGELIKNVSSREDITEQPGLGFSLDRIWVKFSDSTFLPPLFWNFKVMAIDLDTNTREDGSSPQVSASDGLCSFGMVWFHTLLMNQKQNRSKLSLSLSKGADWGASDPIFLPVNIFWNPEGRAVQEKWHPLWGRSLRLGWSLFQTSLNGSPKWSREVFLREMDLLREEVRKNLFLEESIEPGRTKKSETVVETKTKDETIHTILAGMLDQWLMKEKGGELLPETIILSPLKGGRDSSSASKLDGTEKTGPSIERDKTAISSKAARESHGEDIEDIIVETVILGAEKKISSPPNLARGIKETSSDKKEDSDAIERSEARPPGEDLMAETVILGPKKIQDSPKSKRNE